MSDFRFVVRQLCKTPGFTAVVVLSLALGIGANTTVLSWIRHVLYRPLPGVAHQEQHIALLACWVPAWCATRGSPIKALRSE